MGKDISFVLANAAGSHIYVKIMLENWRSSSILHYPLKVTPIIPFVIDGSRTRGRTCFNKDAIESSQYASLSLAPGQHNVVSID